MLVEQNMNPEGNIQSKN